MYFFPSLRPRITNIYRKILQILPGGDAPNPPLKFNPLKQNPRSAPNRRKHYDNKNVGTETSIQSLSNDSLILYMHNA